MRLCPTLVAPLVLGGCSLLYNPSNLPVPIPDAQVFDAAPGLEAVIDADPAMLTLTGVTPAVLFEGQGAGSRRAVIAISGTNLVNDHTTVTLAIHAGETKTPMLLVDNTQIDVAMDGSMLAVPVTLPIDPLLLATDLIRLDVTVTQMTAAGPISKTLSSIGVSDGPVLSAQGLGELSGTNVVLAPTDPPTMFSSVDVTGTLSATAGSTLPLVVRATASITVGGVSAVNAAGQTGGTAGGRGGDGGAGGVLNGSTGMAGTGPAPGQPSGGIGGFIGMDQITTLANPNRGSGGAGGDGVSLGAAGGKGGGGGGSIELSAGGDLSVGSVEAKGASGTSATNSGGAGSGGIVLLRAGGSLTVTGTVDVTGGAGPGTPGAAGRARCDAPGTITVTSNPATRYRGPTFVPATPLIVHTDTPTLTIVGQPSRQFIYFANNADGSASHGPVTALIPPTGTANVQLGLSLFPGTNQLCAIVEGASPGTPEAGNCIEIVNLGP